MLSKNLAVLSSMSAAAMFGPPAFMDSGTFPCILWAIVAFALTAVSVHSLATMCDAYRRMAKISDSSKSTPKKPGKLDLTIPSLEVVISMFGGKLAGAGYSVFLSLYLMASAAIKVSRAAWAVFYYSGTPYESASAFCIFLGAVLLFASRGTVARVKLIADVIVVGSAGLLLCLLLLTLAGGVKFEESSPKEAAVVSKGMWPAVSGVLLSFTFSFQVPFSYSAAASSSATTARWQMMAFGLSYILFSIVYNVALPHAPHPLRMVLFNFVGPKPVLQTAGIAHFIFALTPFSIAVSTIGVTATQISEIFSTSKNTRLVNSLLLLVFCGLLAAEPAHGRALSATWSFSGCVLHAVFIAVFVICTPRIEPRQDTMTRMALRAALIFWVLLAVASIT
jgi:hypothetical protein